MNGFCLAVALFAGAEPSRIGWPQLLASHRSDFALQASRERSKELAEGQTTQLWQDLEFRYEGKRADLRKQEFGLKVSPLGFGESRADRTFWRARGELGERQVEVKRTQALRDRYDLGLEWLFRRRERAYHLEMAGLRAKRVEVLSALSVEDRFRADELVMAQVERTEYLSKAEGDLFQIAQAEGRMRALIPGGGELDLEGSLLGARAISSRLDSLDRGGLEGFPQMKLAQGNLDLEQARTDREVASLKRWLAYLDASYTVDMAENPMDGLTARDNVALGFGVKIPFLDGGSQGVARRRADLAQARWKFQEERESMARKLSELRLSVGSLVRQMAVLDSFARRVDAGKLFTDYVVKSGSDPLLLLKARQVGIESAWKIEQIHFEVLRRYLDILEITGDLAKDPDRCLILSGVSEAPVEDRK